jgi:molybdate transport system ATP-binding protein
VEAAVSSLAASVMLKRGALELEATIHCAAGEVAAVVGPTGAGKTTLLRCLAGLEPRLDCFGFVRVGNELWHDDEEQLYLPPHRRRIGVVFQESRLFPHLGVRGNLGYGWKRRHGVADVDFTARQLGIAQLLDRRVDDLSGGERQLVALARALVSGPSLLLLDEPLASIDSARRAALVPTLLTLIRRLAVPVVWVTHSRAEVLQVADQVYVLQAGKVVANGPVAKMAAALAVVPPEPGEDLAALVEAHVVRHDDGDALTYLEFAGGTFVVPRLAVEVGGRHRLLVHARDVSVALQPPTGSSILNVYPARVEAIDQGEDGQPLLRLAVGTTLLLARVTRRSLRELDLAPGKAVFAQVKAVALA